MIIALFSLNLSSLHKKKRQILQLRRRKKKRYLLKLREQPMPPRVDSAASLSHLKSIIATVLLKMMRKKMKKRKCRYLLPPWLSKKLISRIYLQKVL